VLAVHQCSGKRIESERGRGVNHLFAGIKEGQAQHVNDFVRTAPDDHALGVNVPMLGQRCGQLGAHGVGIEQYAVGVFADSLYSQRRGPQRVFIGCQLDGRRTARRIGPQPRDVGAQQVSYLHVISHSQQCDGD